jgi:hypothetical protein
MGGGGGSSGPTAQQQQLETNQAITNANLNIEENSQRKAILNAMQGTRVFRGSALSRSLAGNTPGNNPAPGPSNAQMNAPFIGSRKGSLLDMLPGSGAGGAGGAGPSNAGAGAIGTYGGRGSSGGGAKAQP